MDGRKLYQLAKSIISIRSIQVKPPTVLTQACLQLWVFALHSSKSGNIKLRTLVPKTILKSALSGDFSCCLFGRNLSVCVIFNYVSYIKENSNFINVNMELSKILLNVNIIIYILNNRINHSVYYYIQIRLTLLRHRTRIHQSQL